MEHNPDNKIGKMSKPYITSQTREKWNIIFYVSTNSIQPQVKILNEIQSYSVNTTWTKNFRRRCTMVNNLKMTIFKRHKIRKGLVCYLSIDNKYIHCRLYMWHCFQHRLGIAIKCQIKSQLWMKKSRFTRTCWSRTQTKDTT